MFWYFFYKGITNQPKASEFDSDEDDEMASKRYLQQVTMSSMFSPVGCLILLKRRLLTVF